MYLDCKASFALLLSLAEVDAALSTTKLTPSIVGNHKPNHTDDCAKDLRLNPRP